MFNAIGRWGLAAACACWCATASAQPMRMFNTAYYSLKTNVSDADARETSLRITAMFEEYQHRTRGFAGTVNRKMPFELHREYQDYLNSSSAPGTAGIYDGNRLVAAFVKDSPEQTWHVVQHEGFHQFVDLAMGRDAIPIWANEGLAEYFGMSLWTGDGFVSGVIPPKRLAKVKNLLRAGAFRPLISLMRISHAQWNQEGDVQNYDQAWMLVHYLAHADNGKYAKPFADFLAGARAARNWEALWSAKLGGDVGDLEKRWRTWWLEQPDEGTTNVYAQAACGALTSYYARSMVARQKFETFDAFLAAARDGKLQASEENWLPKTLLDFAIDTSSLATQWRLDGAGGRSIVGTLPNNREVVGKFKIANGTVKEVTVEERAVRPTARERDPVKPDRRRREGN